MIKLRKIIKKFKLKEVYLPEGVNKEEFKFETHGTTNGYYEYLDVRHGSRIVVWGLNDQKVFEKLETEQVEKFFKNISDSQVVVLSREFEAEAYMEFFAKNNLVVLAGKYEKYEILSMLNNYISHKKSVKTRVHGSLVNIFGEGVLIVGKSGIGKSELVIDLINAKHAFVADDAVDISMINDRIVGQSASITKDFIELRGVGIINVRKTFGIKSVLKRTEIDMVVELVELDDVRDSIDRLGNRVETYKVNDDISIEKIQIPVSSGRQLLSIVESAVTVHKHRKYENYSAVSDLSKQLRTNNEK